MTAKAQQEPALGTLLANRWEQVSRKFEQLAGEVPDDKFEWRPQAGIRNCGEVLRHVAFWNRYLADSLLGREANDTLNELPAAEYPTKAKILKALRQTADDVTGALRQQHASPDPKITELVVSFIEHTSEHYGQLVIYARLLNVVPPASRG